MIRLYADIEFKLGAQVALTADELRYFRSVRRGKGEVTLFNRTGQIAYGKIEESRFRIDRIEENLAQIWPIQLAVALPENAVIPLIIRSASELGVESLYFFESARTQNFKKRIALPRWEKIAMEACRQSGRPRPIELKFLSWKNLLGLTADQVFLFDESPNSEARSGFFSKNSGSTLLIVGCEGGWTEEERDIARQRKWRFVHFPTPVLRVETAAICAAFFGVLQKPLAVDPVGITT